MSKSFLNFLSKKIEYLKLEKKSSKLKDFSSKAENIFDTNGGLTAQQLKETIDYDKLAEELTNSKGSSLASDLSVNVGSIFGEFVNLVGKDSIDGVLDDGYKDGIITGDELEKYMETLMGDDNVLTLSDFDEAIESANIDLEEEMNSILKEAEDSKIKDVASKGASGGGSSIGSSSSKNKNALDTSKKETSNKDPKDMSLDELKSEQSQEAANLGTYKDEMNSAINAREENQAKQEEYINQLKSTQDETASQLADIIQNISDYETNIFQAQEGINTSNARIATLKGEITSLNTTVGNLNGQISALESQTTEDGQKVDNSAEIAQLRAQIEQAEQSIKEKESEISTEENNIAQYDTTIQTNQGLYDNANEQKAQLEEKLSSDIKDKISQAKTDYETEQQTNNKAIAQAQSSFEKSQARLNDIERYIALKDKPVEMSEKANEFLDEINNPDKEVELNEQHYEDLFDKVQSSDLSISEKMYLMTQLKSAVNIDKSISGLEVKFNEFIKNSEIQKEITSDKTGKLSYQADFIQNNSTETLGNLKISSGETGPLIVDGIKYQKITKETGSPDGIYEYAIVAPEGVDVNADLPVLFYMTGRGTNEAGMDVAQYNVFGNLFGQGGLNGFNGIVVIPLSSGNALNVTNSHINDVVDICDEIKSQYPNADTGNMGLIGFSDGATRAYQVANAEQLNDGNYHFDSVLMIDRAEGYTSEDDDAFVDNNIHLGVYYSYVYGSECKNIQAAEFNEQIANDHVGAQSAACNHDTLRWLFKNRG